MSVVYRGTKCHIIEWEDDFIHDLHFILLATVWQGQSLQFVNTNTFLDTKLFNTDTFSVLKKTNYYTSSSSGIRYIFGTLKLTNFWGIVLDDHWSKKIYSPKMIVDVGCYIHLRWSCFNCYQNFSLRSRTLSCNALTWEYVWVIEIKPYAW